MGPMAECGYALETSTISSPYLLRMILDLVYRLRAPWETADLYSGRDPAVAASDAEGYDMVKPWCTATIQYLVGNPRGFDQLELLDCLVQNAHFDPCDLC